VFIVSSVARKVRDLIAEFGTNVLFTSKNLLGCGRRNAVDIEVYRLVKAGKILRVAAGVFMRIVEGMELPSMLKTACVKANRFSRRLYEAEETPPHTHAETSNTFHTDGSSTSMLTIAGRIFLKHRAPAKAASRVGEKPESASCQTEFAGRQAAINSKAENCLLPGEWAPAGFRLSPAPYPEGVLSEILLYWHPVCRLCGTGQLLPAGKVLRGWTYRLQL
jgi:hypothetical protein